MRTRHWVLLALCVCLPTVAFAQTQLAISPSQIFVFENQESFVRITGNNLLGTVGTKIIFSGPVRAENIPSNASSSLLDVWLPTAVAITAGQYAVTIEATDATAVRTIGPIAFNVVERTSAGSPPQISLPEIVVGEATSSDGGNVSFDDGGAACSRPSGSLFPMGTTSVTCSASNAFGTTALSFVVVVTDTVAPDITVPADIVQENPVVTYTATATDNIDGSITSTTTVPYLSCFPASGATFPAGETTVQCVAADRHFNFARSTFKVNISTGVPPPTLFLPGDFEVEAEGATTSVDYVATATNGTIVCSPGSGALFVLGTTRVNCSATNTDNETTTGGFNITVVDTIGPAVTGDDIVAEATGASGAAVTFTVTATDLVDGNRPVTCAPASGSTFALGTTVVQCTATDTHGNLGKNSFDVTVRDTTPPVLTLPANITAEATGASGAAVSYTATATDVVDGSVTPVCSAASGSTFALGTTTVNCTATDAHNNQSQGSFTVTVRDTTAPNLTVPADKTVEATSFSGAVVTYTTSATDIVDGSVTPVCAPASGSTFPLGNTSVQCSATDAHGNHSDKSFVVTVGDTTPPVIQNIDGTPREVLWPNNHKMQNTTIVVSATDAVDPQPHAHIVSVTSDQPVNDGGDGDTSPDWAITGELTVQLRSERTSGIDRHYTITVEVTDFSGNTSTGILVIVVRPGS